MCPRNRFEFLTEKFPRIFRQKFLEMFIVFKNERKPFVWFESELGGHFEPNNFEILDPVTFVTWHVTENHVTDQDCDIETIKIFYPKMAMDQSHHRIPISERIRRTVHWLGFENNFWFLRVLPIAENP